MPLTEKPFQVKSASDLLKFSTQMIQDYHQQVIISFTLITKVKLKFQEEQIWLNVRERMIEDHFRRELSRLQYERQVVSSKDPKHAKILWDSVNMHEFKNLIH